MNSVLPPWAYGPYELLLHAELHVRDGEDFDRRIAMISYDNAIEVAITVYLSLNPIQRQGRKYDKVKMDSWLKNYHRKIDFLMQEIKQRKIKCEITKEEIVWYHDIRNKQYHGGGNTIPQLRDLQKIRQIAMWIFSFLYDIENVDQIIITDIQRSANNRLPSKNKDQDILIDKVHGVYEIAGHNFYTSEILYALDPILYSEIATGVATEDTQGDGEENQT